MKSGWRGALGVAISVALLWWTLRGESPAAVWAVLRESNVWWFLVATFLATIAFPIRAWRWRYILEPAVGKLPFQPLWQSTAIGMMVNNVALARAGELARAFVLARSTGRVSFAAALASLVVDRLFDMLVILLLLFVVVLMPGFPADATVAGWSVERLLTAGVALALVALVVITSVAVYPDRMLRIWELMFGRLAPRFTERSLVILQSFGSGLGVLRDYRRSAIVFFIALAQWLLNGVSFWFAFLAVGLDAGFNAALFLQSLVALSVAVPSAPGFFGVFEASTKVALAAYGVDDTFAVSYALGYHLLTFVPITVIGFWYLWRMGLHVRDFRRDEPPDEKS
jgi:uncharacterized protein (TIRG00374 family)